MPSDPSALIASVTQDLLNDVVLFAVGAGIPVDPLDQPVALPGMGEVDLSLALTVTGGRLDLRPDDGGRVRAVATGLGVVDVRGRSYTGEEADGAAMGFPQVPAPIPVRVEALLEPVVELRADHTVSVGIDLGSAELVSLLVDPDAPVPEGVDTDAWASITQMVQVMFHSMGADLWAALGEHVGHLGAELGSDVGDVLHHLGVAPGRAAVRVGSGTLTLAFAGGDHCVGHADPVPVAGKRLGIGLCASGLDHLGRLLLERALGGAGLPFEIDLELGEQQLGGRVRNTRIFDRLPDLRPALRTEVRPRLVDGRMEIALQAAWVELPTLVPSFVNDLSRRVGGLVSMVPARLRFPATIQLPVIPDSDDTLPVHVEELRVTADGVGVSLALD